MTKYWFTTKEKYAKGPYTLRQARMNGVAYMRKNNVKTLTIKQDVFPFGKIVKIGKDYHWIIKGMAGEFPNYYEMEIDKGIITDLGNISGYSEHQYWWS